MLHISELADEKVENPEEMVKLGQELEVKILRVDLEDRKIGLSLKRVRWAEEQDTHQQDPTSSPAPKQQLRGGLHGSVDLGSDYISYSVLNGSGPSQESPAAEQSQQPSASQAGQAAESAQPPQSEQPDSAEKGA